MDTSVEDARKISTKEQPSGTPREYVINLIAHVNHGKTTVMDNVLEYLGVITKSMAGEARLLDSRKDELERGMTMKLSPVSMFVGGAKMTFLDTPGHLEFNSLTESTFILSDVSLVIADVMKGVTERLRQLVKSSVENKCKPILFINKIDILFKMEISSDEIEYRIETALREINQVLSEEISWEAGTVIVGSAKDNWALSKYSDPSKIMGKKIDKFSLKKAVRLLRTIYMQKEKELHELSLRINRKTKTGLKDKIQAKDIVSYEFGFFSTLYMCVRHADETSSGIYRDGNSSSPDEVCAVVCANTIVNGEITAIARTLAKKRISVGQTVTVMENSSESECTVAGLVYFTESLDAVSAAMGLVGIQGIDCKKRGIISLSKTEKAKEFLHSLRWPRFTPLFTDIIIPAPEHYDAIIKRLTRLSRCEPGLFLSIKQGRVIVKSDGVLQIDKIRTDLEGLSFETQEQSEVYQETVEGGSGVVSVPQIQQNFKITFKQVNSNDTDESALSQFKKVFNRECYVKFSEEVPPEIKMSISSLLQNGPFLLENCNMLSVEVSPTEESATGTVSQIYLQSSPRILVNHTVLHISVPSTHSKVTSNILSKSPGYILSTEIGENLITFDLRIPISEIKDLTNTLRTQTRGEADILPTNTIYYMVPDKKEYENALSETVREKKGLIQKEKIE
ncbi:elongation factor 2 [Nematocida minor]|uniref:elongation factor 2 n=1 Tax=Nematocida minor TaxID=1912983 RepID=UPI00221EC5C1|nr:elongation factor 2 [Nematocida minor]KAI5192950.1 elongation factor 2 [Nematocida minor]